MSPHPANIVHLWHALMCMINDMMASTNLPSNIRDSLTRLAESSDRAPPTVFAGRDDEIGLLNAAMRGAQRGEPGHTVVIQGVPGAGKTALLNEYAARLLTANGKTKKPIIPVPLRPSDLDVPPVAILQEIDRQFREFEASSEWGGRVNRIVGGASLIGNTLFAAFTKRDFNDFRLSARAPDSLPIALDDYVAFRFDRRDSAIVLLVDEAQNLSDTRQVRTHLDSLHGGVKGHPQVVLACFGLENTTDRLRELGLSRLSNSHVRSIATLSSAEAEQTVIGTLDDALAGFVFDDGPFDESRRKRWISEAANTILAESANFPHHLTNGCRALAEIALDEGIGDGSPVERLRNRCRDHRREYYDARLRPWRKHTTALALAFGNSSDRWMPVPAIKRALMASDDFGDPVDRRTASTILKQLCANGYIEERTGTCHPALPSLASHCVDIQRNMVPDNEIVQTVRAALSQRGKEKPQGLTR